MEESSLAKANVRVMQHDSQSNSWVSSDSGLSRVQFFHNPNSDTYRVVGWDLSDRKVVLNCAVVRGMKYNRARQTFHQWRDSKQQVYGLNFSSVDEADAFALAVEQALERMNGTYQRMQQQAPPQPMSQPEQVNSQNNYVSSSANQMVTGEYVMPRTQSAASTRSDEVNGQSHGMYNGGSSIPNGSNTYSTEARFQSSSDDTVRVSSHTIAPNGFRPSGLARTTMKAQSSPERPVSPRQTEERPYPPIPPPPPVPSSNSSDNRPSRPLHRSNVDSQPVNGDHTDEDDEGGGGGGGAFAAELRAARKLRTRASSTAGTEPQRSSTLGRSGGTDMMSDLQRVLAARRRAQQDGDTTDQPAPPDDTRPKSSNTSNDPAPISSNSSAAPSYATLRKNSVPVVETTRHQLASVPNKAANNNSNAPVSRADLEAFKRDVLTEFRREMQQLKNEVIEALRASSNRA